MSTLLDQRKAIANQICTKMVNNQTLTAQDEQAMNTYDQLASQYASLANQVFPRMANYVSGEVKLQKDETDKYAWVSLKEAKKYDLIDGIYDELVMAENKIKGIKSEWKRT